MVTSTIQNFHFYSHTSQNCHIISFTRDKHPEYKYYSFLTFMTNKFITSTKTLACSFVIQTNLKMNNHSEQQKSNIYVKIPRSSIKIYIQLPGQLFVIKNPN